MKSKSAKAVLSPSREEIYFANRQVNSGHWTVEAVSKVNRDLARAIELLQCQRRKGEGIRAYEEERARTRKLGLDGAIELDRTYEERHRVRREKNAEVNTFNQINSNSGEPC